MANKPDSPKSLNQLIKIKNQFVQNMVNIKQQKSKDEPVLKKQNTNIFEGLKLSKFRQKKYMENSQKKPYALNNTKIEDLRIDDIKKTILIQRKNEQQRSKAIQKWREEDQAKIVIVKPQNKINTFTKNELTHIYGKHYIQQQEDEFQVTQLEKLKKIEQQKLQQINSVIKKNLQIQQSKDDRFNIQNHFYKQDQLLQNQYIRGLKPIHKAEQYLQDSIFDSSLQKFYLVHPEFNKVQNKTQQIKHKSGIFYSNLNQNASQIYDLTKVIKDKAQRQYNQWSKSIQQIESYDY